MPDPIDTVLRTVAVMAAILLASLLFASARQRPAALPGAFFCLAVAAFFVTSVPGGGAILGGWGYLLTALCVTKAVWFWLFARALFNDEARLGTKEASIAGAVAVAGTWQQTVFLTDFRAGTANGWEIMAGYGFEATLLLFVLLGVREAWRDLAVDLVERRRRLRLGFMIATGAYLTVTLGVQSYNLLQGVSTPPLAAWANMMLVAAACLTAAGFLVRPRNESWLDPARTATTVALNRAESAALARLEAALESDRVFLQEGLTIGALAEHLGTREHVLRKVINRGMGFRNFNDFLHAHRIREACEELASPEQARLPVLTIAMNVGYGSIGAFNRAFKARIGMTPTEYRRNTAGGASQAL
ncbi:helix-turn-helix domain-containing protein [Lentisalinibacter sediminis]|uniref:helix-turn-helix domain-containing protein n=1 Tax=Lentisalinibacter sediminis TaxID=2992237 RepID=UPI003865D6BE